MQYLDFEKGRENQCRWYLRGRRCILNENHEGCCQEPLDRCQAEKDIDGIAWCRLTDGHEGSHVYTHYQNMLLRIVEDKPHGP